MKQREFGSVARTYGATETQAPRCNAYNASSKSVGTGYSHAVCRNPCNICEFTAQLKAHIRRIRRLEVH